MATERLHFDAPDHPYHAFDAAVHAARYGLARTMCADKRVLDIACGEGYGSLLLRRWGAARVVGVDVAAEAIAVAKRLFADPAIEYLCCDAYDLPERLGDEALFDVIVSFETIEHVQDPKRLLHMLRSLLAPGGVMMVSCPNDEIAYHDGGSNPFHLASYSFEDFRRLCEEAAGPVTQWMIETPSVGAVLVTRERLLGDETGGPEILRGEELDHAIIMPPQANVRPSLKDCLAYIAIWGARFPDAVAASPVSYSGYMYPWKRVIAAERAEAELARAGREIQELQAENRRLRAEQQEDRRQLLLYAERLRVEALDAGAAIECSRRLRVEALDAGAAIECSRVYRLTRSRRLALAYVRIFDQPILGAAMRSARAKALRLLGVPLRD
jgi:SAM-dependent methyltransferase